MVSNLINFFNFFYVYFPFSDIEQNLREKYQRLRDHISLLKEQRIRKEGPDEQREEPGAQEPQYTRTDTYEDEIEDLMRQLSDYREIIAQQEEMLVVSVV